LSGVDGDHNGPITQAQDIQFKAMSFILGKKLKMSQIWKDGKVVPVTIVHAEPNKVSLVRTKERDGYEAVQVSLGKKKREFSNRTSQPIDMATMAVDNELSVDSFKEGDKVRVSGIMKGRGFQGVVKRYNFAGGPKTHGQKNRHRAPGSIGSTAFQRVVPGRRMAGHMGVTRITVKNLVVAAIDKENNLIFLKGPVPGGRGGLIEIANVK
jgi:large subunit ribosomal protein L3